MSVFRVSKIAPSQLSHEEYGSEGRSVLLIDNFYENPVAVRKHVMSLSFGPPEGFPYPGEVCTDEIDQSGLETVLAEILALRPSEFDIASFFSKISDRENNLPHIDPYDLSGVIYLNLPNQCAGGTAFFRHREYKVESAAFNNGRLSLKSESEKHGFTNEHDFLNRIKSKWTEWEITKLVPMRFNRFVLFQPSSYHGLHFEEKDFDDTMDKCRLTQNFFVRY